MRACTPSGPPTGRPVHGAPAFRSRRCGPGARHRGDSHDPAVEPRRLSAERVYPSTRHRHGSMGRNLSWSPDGKFIAFDRMKSGNSDVYIKPIDGGNAVARVSEPGDQGSPRWSPDGRHLAYVSNEPGSPVFLVPPDGGKPRELIRTNLPALSSAMNALMGDRPWSGDGKTLLVSTSTDGRQFAVHRVNRDTRESKKLTSPPAGSHDSYATYSFDDKRILFLRGGSWVTREEDHDGHARRRRRPGSPTRRCRYRARRMASRQSARRVSKG